MSDISTLQLNLLLSDIISLIDPKPLSIPCHFSNELAPTTSALSPTAVSRVAVPKTVLSQSSWDEIMMPKPSQALESPATAARMRYSKAIPQLLRLDTNFFPMSPTLKIPGPNTVDVGRVLTPLTPSSPSLSSLSGADELPILDFLKSDVDDKISTVSQLRPRRHSIGGQSIGSVPGAFQRPRSYSVSSLPPPISSTNTIPSPSLPILANVFPGANPLSPSLASPPASPVVFSSPTLPPFEKFEEFAASDYRPIVSKTPDGDFHMGENGPSILSNTISNLYPAVVADRPPPIHDDDDKYIHKCSVAGCLKSYSTRAGLRYHFKTQHKGMSPPPTPTRLAAQAEMLAAMAAITRTTAL
ncbi:hypothetical protein HK102_012581 [Quaeritorhiza haematococci]|nr:hypothetical protein HK102_012581 [Quaeritorhiza haematococci]